MFVQLYSHQHIHEEKSFPLSTFCDTNISTMEELTITFIPLKTNLKLWTINNFYTTWGWVTGLVGRGWENWAFQAKEEEATLGASNSSPWWQLQEGDQDGKARLCPVFLVGGWDRAQSKIREAKVMYRAAFSLWGQEGSRAGCPWKVYSLHHWNCSGSSWTKPWANWSGLIDCSSIWMRTKTLER